MQRFASLFSHHLRGFKTFAVQFCYFKHEAEISSAKSNKCLLFFFFFWSVIFLMSTTQSSLSCTESLAGSSHSKILRLIFIEIFCPSGFLERVTQRHNLFLNSLWICFISCHFIGQGSQLLIHFPLTRWVFLTSSTSVFKNSEQT